MDVMDIAGLSMGLSHIKTSTDIGMAVLAKSLDMMEVTGKGMVELIEGSTVGHSVSPGLGGNIDVMV